MSPATPALSVIMSVYNNAPFLDEAIESILSQSFGDFEFLIVNDGSNDGSGAILDAYAARDARVRVIHQANRGFVPSLNTLLHESRASLIARMDGDDISLPGRFAKQMDWLAAHPTYGIVGGRIRSIDEQGTPIPMSADVPLDDAAFAERLPHGPLLYHNTVIMRSDLVRQVGGYHAAFRHAEDYDLWLRLSEVTKLANLPDDLALYRRYGTSVSSRHLVEQATNAAISWLCYQARQAGRPDPLSAMAHLPPLDQIDSHLGAGAAEAICARVAPAILYSPDALTGNGFEMILSYARKTGGRAGLSRTVARLLTLGEPRRALRLAAALMPQRRAAA